MSSKAFLIGLLFVGVLNPVCLPAQDSACTQRTIAVGVVDRQWNLVPNLSAANFRGKLHGREVQTLSAAVDTNPRRIVLLLDVSGSMTDKWRTEKSISEYLIKFSPTRASIAQMTFGERIIDAAGFEQDRPELLRLQALLFKACEQGHHGGRTALYDAIARARSSLGNPNVGDAIFALTDAGDNHSHIDEKKLEANLLSAGIRLFVTIIRMDKLPERARTPEGLYGPGQLRDLVEATGGMALTVSQMGISPPLSHFHAKSGAEAVDLALQRLFGQMGEFYRLDVRLPETVENPTKWKLEVTDAGGKPMRNVEVQYPQELIPCAQASH